MGTLLLDILKSDAFLKMWRKPEEHKDHLQQFMISIYSVMRGSKSFLSKTTETPQGLDLDEYLPEFSKLASCWERIDVIFKCIDFAWCLCVTSPSESPATPADVLKITAYKGKEPLETTLQDISIIK